MNSSEKLRRPAAPRTRSILEQMVGRYSKHYQIPQGRVRNWISFMVIGGALERVVDADGSPAFVVKGGVAIELRLRLRARTTRDFDASFRDGVEKLLPALDRAFEEPYGEFRLSRRGVMQDVGGRAKRVEIRVEYRHKPWSTVQMEIAPGQGRLEAERIAATDLSEFGLDGPGHIHCLSARFQIAQKIHAVTSLHPTGRPNDRFRDLVDLWLLRELGTDPRALREACEAVFVQRNTHGWPPAIVVPDHWPAPFARLAAEVGLTTLDVHEAAASIQAYIHEIARAA